MAITFQKATKKQAKARVAFEGPAGYGKTYSATGVGIALLEPGQRLALIDTESHSASKYAHRFDFDVIEIDPPFHPRRVVEAIRAAEDAGYGAVVIDSLSHFWQGKGGVLDIVAELAKVRYRGDSHAAWRDGDEIQRELIDAILRSRIHVIATMRTKSEHVREEVERDGQKRTIIRKAGTKTVQRDEFDFEFDIVARFDVPEIATIIKTRCDALPPETIIKKPGADFARTLREWLDDGAPAPVASTPVAARQPETTPSGGNIVPVSELKARAERESNGNGNGNGKTGYINTEPVLGDKVARDALITECVHIWGKSVDAAKAFVKERDLPSALTKWSDADLTAFKEHMTAVALAKA